MTSRRSVFRRAAERLATHAGNVMPSSAADWARAMHNEVHHISGNREAFTWALGCVLTSYTKRMRTMICNRPRISAWVLAIEMISCFMPLTLLCVAVLANLNRLDGKTGILALTVAATGPIGLVIAFRVVVLNRPLLGKYLIAALCVLAVWTCLAYSLQILSGGQALDHWRDFVLIALLPALGIVHLLHVATRSPIKAGSA